MFLSSDDTPKANILVVDDTHANLHLLTDILTQKGYAVRPVPNGQLALSSIQAALPDLILLDIMMPTMSGYEVCQRLKADEYSREIPVIFISALHEVFDKVKAFELGGVDYISKPFQPEEVLARIETHLALRNLQKTLQEKNRQLEQEILERERAEAALQDLNITLENRVEQRTNQLQDANTELQRALDTLKITQEQLIQSEKMALLISLVAGIAHEINTPVGVGLTAATHLEQTTIDFDALYQEGELKRSDLERYMKTVTEAAQIIYRNMQLAAQRTQSFKEMAVDQASGHKRPFNLKNYINEVFLNLQPHLKKTSHTTEIHCPDDIQINSYPGAFSQIITNLILNSLQHGFDQKKQGRITLDVQCDGHTLHITYQDDGKGMNDEQCSRVFDAFFTTKRAQGGSGLGMNIVHNLVTHKLHGNIRCESIPEQKTAFILELPCDGAEVHHTVS